MQGSGLPSLMQSRLHAPRILKMTKVATYVAQKLEAEQLYYVPHAFYYKASWQMTEVCIFWIPDYIVKMTLSALIIVYVVRS